jgi:hypothetical protein
MFKDTYFSKDDFTDIAVNIYEFLIVNTEVGMLQDLIMGEDYERKGLFYKGAG